MSSSTPPRTPPLFIPHSIEQLIAQICKSKEVSPPDASARRSLASLDEQSAIEILKKIDSSSTIRTFSGFIHFLVKGHKENNINNNVSPHKRVRTINQSPTTLTTPITPVTTSFAFASPSNKTTTTVARVLMWPVDEVEDDTIPLEPVTRKKALIASKTLHNFLVQFENTTPELLDAVRKVRDELQLDLSFKKRQTTLESYFPKLS